VIGGIVLFWSESDKKAGANVIKRDEFQEPIKKGMTGVLRCDSDKKGAGAEYSDIIKRGRGADGLFRSDSDKRARA
jgi:hypothetical protein